MTPNEIIEKLNLVENQDNSALRDYQKKQKQEIYDRLRVHQNVLLQMPTGTGKTRLFSSIVKDVHKLGAKNKIALKVLILAHRRELIDQISDNIGHKYNVSHGLIISKKESSPKYPTQIASIQTLIRRIDEWRSKRFDIIIIDEAHHAIASTYLNIIDEFENAKVIGVTATPYRLGGEALCNIFDDLITSPPVYKFIQDKFLSNYNYFSIKDQSKTQKIIDSITKKSPSGDFDDIELDEKINTGRIRAKLVESYKKHANGLKGIVYTINKSHNLQVCQSYNDNGISAKAIDSNTSSTERERIVREFKNDEFKVLCNVNIFTEGFDCPDIEFIQLARPTKSLSMYLQQVGRGLRIHDEIHSVVILDNVGLYNKFGLPSAIRHWNYHFKGKNDLVSYDPKTEINQPLDSERINFIEEGDEEIDLIYNSEPTIFNNSIPLIYRAFDEQTISKINNNANIFESLNSIYKEFSMLSIEEQLSSDNDFLETFGVFKSKKNMLKKAGERFGVLESESGNEIIPCDYHSISIPNLFGYSIIRKKDKKGIYNIENNSLVASAAFDEVLLINNIKFHDCFIVRRDRKFGVIRKDGVISIEIKYNKIKVVGDYISALYKDEWFTFNRYFKLLPRRIKLKPLKQVSNVLSKYRRLFNHTIFADIQLNFFENDFSIIQGTSLFLIKYGKYFGVLNTAGNWIVQPVYVAIKKESDYLIARKEKRDIYSLSGELLLEGAINTIYKYNKLYIYINRAWYLFEDNNLKFIANNREDFEFLIKQNQRLKKLNSTEVTNIKEQSITLEAYKNVIKSIYEKEMINKSSSDITYRINKLAYDLKLSAPKICSIFKLLDIEKSPSSKISVEELNFIKLSIEFLANKNIKI